MTGSLSPFPFPKLQRKPISNDITEHHANNLSISSFQLEHSSRLVQCCLILSLRTTQSIAAWEEEKFERLIGWESSANTLRRPPDTFKQTGYFWRSRKILWFCSSSASSCLSLSLSLQKGSEILRGCLCKCANSTPRLFYHWTSRFSSSCTW